MRLLVLERRQAPTVSLVIHYPVGSVHERLGNTGVAHVVEHMLFKGSLEIGVRDRDSERPLLAAAELARDSTIAELAKPRPDSARVRRLRRATLDLERQAHRYAVPSEFDRLLSAEGARGLNATTSHEATRYFVELPANRLELWFALEADRLARPAFRGFHTELEVVREERRTRLETSAGGTLRAALMATAFQVHPYGVPVVGHASDLEAMTRRQAVEFFRRHYGARNAVVVAVGDVDADRTLRLAERHFAALPAGRPTPPVLAREPEQSGERRIDVEFDAEPRLLIGWRAPPASHPDSPALSALASVLAGGRTSRLHRRLILEDGSAVNATASLGPGLAHSRLFVANVVPRAPHAPADVERALADEIERIRQTPPEPREIERIRNSIRAGAYRRLSSNLGLALQLAESEAALGDWRETFRLDERLADVGPEDVRRVAARYLTDRAKTVATLTRRTGR